MNERKCLQCGAVLSQYNPGKLCFPCQEKNQRGLQERTGDSPNYNVDDMCYILGLKPEQVRRLGRKNVIPGRIPGIKQHLYLKAFVDEWITSRGEFSIPSFKKASEGESDSMDESQKKVSFDKELFITSNSIMNERDIRNLLLSLELHNSYRLSEYLKVAKFWEFTRLEKNKYIDPELTQLLKDLWTVLDEFVLYLKFEFKEDAKEKGERDLECRLDPTGLKYIHDESAKAQRIAEARKKLVELIENIRNKYKAYRAGIRNTLYL